jgi:tetratricopeptide (TPR) repeat protein
LVLRASGEFDAAVELFQEAAEQARIDTDRRMELRARMELEYLRLPRSHGATADDLLAAISSAIPVFDAAQDYRGLGRAWLLSGWVEGGRRGNHSAREAAGERALDYYKRSTWPTSACLGEIAVALYFGPRPVLEAIERCQELLETEVSDRIGRAHIEVFLGGLVAQRGDFDRARDLIASAISAYDELGQRTAAAHTGAPILGDVQLLAGDFTAAEETLRQLCDEHQQTRAFSHLASRAGDLAEALYSQERYDEAHEWTVVAETHTAADDVDALVLWMPVRAKITARRGSLAVAERLARDAVGLAARSDALNRRAKTCLDLSEVLRFAGRPDDATPPLDEARTLFEQKGNLVGAARVRSLREDPAVV